MLKPAGSPGHEERRNAIITHAMNTLEKDHGIYLARKVCIYGGGKVEGHERAPSFQRVFPATFTCSFELCSAFIAPNSISGWHRSFFSLVKMGDIKFTLSLEDPCSVWFSSWAVFLCGATGHDWAKSGASL